jgi:ribosomal protein S18 acetylase RimI-like enzyme
MVRRVIPPAAPQQPGEGHLRAATGADESFIRDLSIEVFDQFGDYGAFLPGYLTHASVFTTIYEEDRPRGFIMVALVLSEQELPRQPEPPVEAQGEREWLDAEVLAIAVSPTHQSRGVGKRLMQHALDLAQAWHQSSALRSLQLNVADTNHHAIAFFRRSGFEVLDPHDGVYPRGQESIRMVCYLPHPA